MDSENVVSIHNGILLSTKKNKSSLFAGKWMELESIILSEVSQVQKAKSSMFSAICVI
jgi:aconitase B